MGVRGDGSYLLCARIKEAKALGAHNVVSSTDPEAIAQSAKSLDLVIVTVNVPLDWSAVISTLAPHGRLHFVGTVLDADFKP